MLAQAAEESGWGCSRFTIEGNSFFGQWDFSGNGMVPAQQRKEFDQYKRDVQDHFTNFTNLMDQLNHQYQRMSQQLSEQGEKLVGVITSYSIHYTKLYEMGITIS